MTKTLYILFLSCIIFSCKNEKQDVASDDVETEKAFNFQNVKDANIYAGKLMRMDSFPSNYIKPRPVDIWLPKNYSEDKKYSVLYAHDGQMLFDSTTTWNKQEWKVDEWATQLIDGDSVKDFVVVAIHNIPENRWQDLFPQKAFELLDSAIQQRFLNDASQSQSDAKFNSDNYLNFIIQELKPVIDESYSVYTDRENTFVMGASMGGLMSMYAISEYPEVFGGAVCISTHWPGAGLEENSPLPNAIFSYMEANLPKAGEHKVYFDYGNKTLDQHYPQYAPRVDEILKAKAYTEIDAKNIFFEGADHSENSWNQRLDQPLRFLLGKN